MASGIRMRRRTEYVDNAGPQVDSARLDMPIGEAISSQRPIRRFRTAPIPIADIRLIFEAAAKAPSGANRQPGRFLAITDRDLIRQFGPLYHEAWWAKRRDERRPRTTREAIPLAERGYRSAAPLADEIGDAP
jgi:nitroreductase